MKPSVAILIPTHCRPKVLKLTLGTWLEHYDRSYGAKVYVGLHGNYEHYGCLLREINTIPHIEYTYTPEIAWDNDLLRYSRMHMMNLRSLLRKAYESDCTHVVVLDHDLFFKADFIKWAIETHIGADWVCGLFDDFDKPRECNTNCWAPKSTVWHMVFNRTLLDLIMRDEQVVMPDIMGKLIYDSFSKVLELAQCEWGLNVRILPEKQIAELVEHIWSMSFNYGFWISRGNKSVEKTRDDHNERQAQVEARYDRHFPDGIEKLLEKLS